MPGVGGDAPRPVRLGPHHGAAVAAVLDLLAVRSGPGGVPLADHQRQPGRPQHGHDPHRQRQSQGHEAGQGAADLAVGAGLRPPPGDQARLRFVLREGRFEVPVAERL